MNVSDIIKAAQKEIGVTEYPPGSNKVKYNTWYYGREVQGADYPWCAAFISWLFRDTKLVIKTASCATMGNWFKNNKRWFTEPQPGDIVFYKFKTTRNNNWTNHVGIVESINADGSIITIEGNTSISSNDNGGAVMRRKRSSSIVGYGRPAYNGIIQAPVTRATLRYGSKSPDVKYLHQRLRTYYYGVNADQDFFDSLTKACVIDFQANHNLIPDGIVGPKTWEKLEVKNGR